MSTRVSGVLMAERVFAVNKAFAESGTVVEATGHNDGPQLDKIEKVWGLKGEPYCAMGQYWAFAKAYCDLNRIPYSADTAWQVFADQRKAIDAEWLHFSPLVADMKGAAALAHQWHPFNGLNDAMHVSHGDLVLYTFPTGHHIEMFDRMDVYGNSWFVGWNTSPTGAVGGNTNDPGAGGGCYYKKRHLTPGECWGWIHWQGGKVVQA